MKIKASAIWQNASRSKAGWHSAPVQFSFEHPCLAYLTLGRKAESSQELSQTIHLQHSNLSQLYLWRSLHQHQVPSLKPHHILTNRKETLHTAESLTQEEWEHPSTKLSKHGTLKNLISKILRSDLPKSKSMWKKYSTAFTQRKTKEAGQGWTKL